MAYSQSVIGLIPHSESVDLNVGTADGELIPYDKPAKKTGTILVSIIEYARSACCAWIGGY